MTILCRELAITIAKLSILHLESLIYYCDSAVAKLLHCRIRSILK